MLKTYFAVYLCLASQALAFTQYPRAIVRKTLSNSCYAGGLRMDEKLTLLQSEQKQNEVGEAKSTGSIILKEALRIGTSALVVIGGSPIASAAEDAMGLEIAELPPPYVPIIFSIGLVAGVGLLTGSLGDVIGEEASLGDMSGAKAKKEMERSRSSYFKKR